MKVFACKRQGSYSGGLILVAASTKEEAFYVFAHDKRFDWMIDSRTPEGSWVDVDAKNAIVTSDYYPLEKWHEVECLTAQVSEPQVIIEDGHSE
ncbi:hypothetical protein SAMN04487851_114117 [Prevotella sp. tc2-28]|uniref:hypothetical protein n=1 Tax=Prevotella sp. tc2-28 TaxID=1761888 RepID=UPI000896E2EB|nr:hypothetical protein [Prevotella sp. tc2-28]SEA81062.1 hypothetical protein SAMN04487851_114117 [Prevotella sp. tc2-28]